MYIDKNVAVASKYLWMGFWSITKKYLGVKLDSVFLAAKTIFQKILIAKQANKTSKIVVNIIIVH